MPEKFRRLTLVGMLAGTVAAAGCSAPTDAESVAVSTDAVNVCDETVPENRYVDGLPAYAQCDLTNGSIWSNNGVDTATSSQGEGWVRTQQGGGYQCTEWAWRYLHFRWGVSYRHGDAKEWCDGDLPDTLVLSATPVHGDLIVFDGGACGADETTGHIAVVDTVDTAGGRVTFVEENRAGRRSGQQSCALCYLHAVANDGTPGTAGAAGAGSAGAPGGAAGAAGRAGSSGSGGDATIGGSGGAPSAGAGGSPSAGFGPGAGTTSGGSPGSGGDVQRAGTGGGSSSAGSASGGAGTTPAAGGATAQGAAPGSGGGSPAGSAGLGEQGMPPGTAGAPAGEVPGAETSELEGGMNCSVGPRRDANSGVLLVALGLLGLGRRRRGRPPAV